MKKKDPKQKRKPVVNRLIILFFYCVFLAVLLWAERFARYRYQYVFRDWLPTVLPAAAGAALIAWIVLLILRLCGKKGGAVLSLDFCLFSVAGLVLALGLPCFGILFPVKLLFGILADLALILICGGAIGYALWFLAERPHGALAGVFALDLAAFLFYWRLFASGSSAILDNNRNYPAEGAVLAGSAAFLALTAAAALLLGKADAARFRLPAWQILTPGGLSLAGLLLCRFLPVTAKFAHPVLWILLPLLFLFFCFLHRKKGKK